MTIDEQIDILNTTVKCTLKPSPIHGIGVFALRDIKKGECVNCLSREATWFCLPPDELKRLRPDVLALILDRWPGTTQQQPFHSPNWDANLMSFMNHSNKPNSQFDMAVRDIKTGEEITEDYDTGNLSDLQKKHYSFLP
jgi:hypothetical protein